ncbi:DUF5688 family protein [Lachnospiraceae bacterium ZAX-1]
MTYEIFTQTLLTSLEEHFPLNTTISIQMILHNNGISLDELTILEPDFDISPTIYLNKYYSLFKQGISFEDIFNHILREYEQHRPIFPIDTSFFTKFENIEKRIVYKLIHFEKNKELLADIPYIPYLDLAIVFYCLIADTSAGSATILIHNAQVDTWDVDVQKLFELSMINTPFLLAPVYEELNRAILSFLPSSELDAYDIAADDPIPMYVLTNENKLNGASCLLYQDLLKDIATRFDSDFYILPSSIHEVLLVPVDGDCYRHVFTPMVLEVNDTEVRSEELLSDHVYYYSRKQNALTM